MVYFRYIFDIQDAVQPLLFKWHWYSIGLSQSKDHVKVNNNKKSSSTDIFNNGVVYTPLSN